MWGYVLGWAQMQRVNMEVCRSNGGNRNQMKTILALIIKGWWQQTNELSVPAVTVELSWKQEISF